jgi:hypothetical protein
LNVIEPQGALYAMVIPPPPPLLSLISPLAIDLCCP